MQRPCLSVLISVGLLAALLSGASPALAATAPPLGQAASFAVLAGSTVTNTGNTIIMGDLGLSPGTSVTGFPPGIVVPPGTTHIADAVALGAQSDATTAFNNLGSQACDFGPFGPMDLAGQVLVPGVYCFSSSVQNTGALTLNGGPADVWVFRIGTTLKTGPGSSVVFTGGGASCNVFWQVGSSATLDTTTTFAGTIIALQSISMNNGVVLKGRALARNGAVTLINDTVDATVCSGVPPSGGIGVFEVFSPSTISAGGNSTKTITFTNTNSTEATLTADFTDTLPAGLMISGTPNVATTCGSGVATATPFGSSVTLSSGSMIPGGSVAIPGFCTLTVNVTSSTVGSFVNTVPVGALKTSLGGNTVSSAATLIVNGKEFGQELQNYFSNAGTTGGTAFVQITASLEGNETGATPAAREGELCAMIYVFDTSQSLQACCGCPVTADGLLTLNISTQLAANPVSPPLQNGSMRIVPTLPNFIEPFPDNLPPGVNCDLNTSVCCNPTGSDTGNSLTPSGVLQAWSQHIQNTAITESEFQRHTPDSVELSDGLPEACADITQLGTGQGACTCPTSR